MTDEQLTHLERQLTKLTEKINSQPTWSRTWDYAIKGIIPVVIAICGWGIGHEVRLSNLELTSLPRNEAHDIHEAMLDARPPAWLKEDLTELKDMLKQLDNRLRIAEMKK